MASRPTNQSLASPGKVTFQKPQEIISYINDSSINCDFGAHEITYLPNDKWDKITTRPTIDMVVHSDNNLDGQRITHVQKVAFVDDIHERSKKLFAITVKAGLGMDFLHALMYNDGQTETISDHHLPLLLSTDTADPGVATREKIPILDLYHADFTNKFQLAQKTMWAPTLMRSTGDLIPSIPFLSSMPLSRDAEPFIRAPGQYMVRFHSSHVGPGVPSEGWLRMRTFWIESLAKEYLAGTACRLVFRCEGKIYCVS
jgi:hypothetical protein